MNILKIGIGASLVLGVLFSGSLSDSLYKIDEFTMQVIVEPHDVSCAVSQETRINIPAQYGGYFITGLAAYHTTAGTEAATDDTEIEIKNITDNVVIDTIVIEPTTLGGVQRDASVSYEVAAGDEIAIKVIEVTDTPGKGLRTAIYIQDSNHVD